MVRLSCGVRCTGAMLFALNIVFLLLGFTVMGLGIFVKVNRNFDAISEIHTVTEALGGGTMEWVGITMIVIGIFTVCLAIFGCLGAVLHNRCCLYAYAVFLTLIILLEFAAVIVILAFRNHLWTTYDSGFLQVFQDSYSQNRTETIKMIEKIEQEFECCGVDGFTDYPKYNFRIPLSCYPDQSIMEPIYIQGCAQAVTKWAADKLPIIAGVLGSILFIEIFGLIASLVLGVAISHSSNAERYEKF